jgi:hypothetical protein
MPSVARPPLLPGGTGLGQFVLLVAAISSLVGVVISLLQAVDAARAISTQGEKVVLSLYYAVVQAAMFVVFTRVRTLNNSPPNRQWTYAAWASS